MSFQEIRFVNQVTILPVRNVIEVQWVDQVWKGEEVIAENFHRKAYCAIQKDEFEAEVENAAVYLAAVNWT